jgi:polyvinyl alcohol dehydrogenase (cytochrome)
VEGALYLNTTGAKIVALDPNTGMMQWTKPHNMEVQADGSSSVIPAGDVLIVGGSSGVDELSGGGKFRGYFSGMERTTGELRWSTFTVPDSARGASIWSSLSADVKLGLGFAGTGNNYGTPTTDTSDSIIAFELSTGAIKWKNQRVKDDAFGGGSGPDADFGANPVLYEAMVAGAPTKLVADGNKGGSVFAMNREDGMLLWERSLGTGAADGSKGIFTNFAWSGKHLVVACNEGGPATLYALDGATGEIVWMRKLTGQVWGRTAFANGVGFVGTGATLEAFDVDTGALIKSWPSAGGTVASTITISRGRVAFGEGLSWSSGKRGTKLTVLSVK